MFEFLDISRDLGLVVSLDFLAGKLKIRDGIVVVYECDFSFRDYRQLDCDLYRVAELIRKRYGIKKDD